jgi:hypothetical protein
MIKNRHDGYDATPDLGMPCGNGGGGGAVPDSQLKKITFLKNRLAGLEMAVMILP